MSRRPDNPRRLILAIAAVATSVALAVLLQPVPANAEFGEFTSYTQDSGRVAIDTSMGTLTISAIDDAAFEVHYAEDGLRQLPSFALSSPGSARPVDLTDSDASLTVRVGELTAIVSKSPVRIAYRYRGQPIVAEESGYFAYDTVRGFRFALDDDEKILGGGQRVLGMDRRGQRMPLYNKAHYGYETSSSQMYYSLPGVMSSNRYAIVFDNSAAGTLDIGHYEPDVLQFEAVGGRTAYLVIAGDTYPGLIRNYTDVTGRQPLPPRWVLGNFASRYGYRNEAQVREVVDRYASANIPLDTVVLDLFWFGPDEKGHMGNLDWNVADFPDGPGLIRDLANDGIRTLLITEPFILTTSASWQDAVAAGALAKNAAGQPKRFKFYFGETGLVDVFSDAGRDWFWHAYRRLFEQGAAGTWGDLGEPEVHPGDSVHTLSDQGIQATGDEIHNVYGHEWARLVYERQRVEFPHMRPAILMRSGFVGSQRYGIIPWTGDVNRSWGGLDPQIELALQMGVFGLGYTHSDLGGFAGGAEFDRELYLRWLQYGVFQPVYRPHAQDHIPPEPVYHDKLVREIAGEAIRLRYRLLPYNYTLAHENSLTGMPLMRPVFFEDESDTALIDVRDRYFWGDAFLVAPIREAGVETARVPLPHGIWFDFSTDRRFVGGQTVTVPVDIRSIPVFVRGGSFVPMLPTAVTTTAAYSSDSLVLHYYSDPEVSTSQGQMYEDDGRDPESLDAGRFEILEFGARQAGEQLTLSLARRGDGYAGMPATRDLTIVIHNWLGELTSVNVGDEPLRIRRRLPARGSAAALDLQSKRLTIRTDWNHAPVDIRIN